MFDNEIIRYFDHIKNRDNDISPYHLKINDIVIFVDYFNQNNIQYHYNYFMKVIKITDSSIFFMNITKEVKDSDFIYGINYENEFLVGLTQHLVYLHLYQMKHTYKPYKDMIRISKNNYRFFCNLKKYDYNVDYFDYESYDF
jgi:hypothetical protein